MNQVTVRWAFEEEHAAALAIYAAAKEGEPALEAFVAHTKEVLGLPGGRLAIASFGTFTDAGMGHYGPAWVSESDRTPVPGRCHISHVFIRPEHQGHGIGRTLLRALMTDAQANGWAQVQLETDADNHRAQALYRSEGFVVEAQGTSSTSGVPTVRMVRGLLVR